MRGIVELAGCMLPVHHLGGKGDALNRGEGVRAIALIPALLFRRAWRGAMWLRCVATLLVLLPVALLGADEASPSATGLQLMKEHAAKGVRAAQWGARAACTLHHVHTGGARRPEPHCVGVRTSQRCLSGRRMLRASPSSCERRVLCSSRPTRMRIRNRVCVWVVKRGLAARVEKGKRREDAQCFHP